MKNILTSLTVIILVASSLVARADEAAEVKITADKLQFLYDVKEFTVKPGQTVKLTLVNPADSVNRQPHNILIVKPGKKEVVGMAASDPKLMSNPEFLKDPVPESEDILHHSKLLQPGEEETLEFTAPTEPGDYPYLCTFPGHWAIMNGVMKVVE